MTATDPPDYDHGADLEAPCRCGHTAAWHTLVGWRDPENGIDQPCLRTGCGCNVYLPIGGAA